MSRRTVKRRDVNVPSGFKNCRVSGYLACTKAVLCWLASKFHLRKRHGCGDGVEGVVTNGHGGDGRDGGRRDHHAGSRRHGRGDVHRPGVGAEESQLLDLRRVACDGGEMGCLLWARRAARCGGKESFLLWRRQLDVKERRAACYGRGRLRVMQKRRAARRREGLLGVKARRAAWCKGEEGCLV